MHILSKSWYSINQAVERHGAHLPPQIHQKYDYKWKNSLEGTHSRITEAEEWINEL